MCEGQPPEPEPQHGTATAPHRSELETALSADGTPPSPLHHHPAADMDPAGRYDTPAWHPVGFAPLPEGAEKDHQSNIRQVNYSVGADQRFNK